MTINLRATWPFPWSPWPSGPWEMRGTVATAWFLVGRAEVAPMANSHLLPNDEEDVLCRVRFYDIEYTSLSEIDDRTAARSGRFREAVVAYRGAFGHVGGDVSAVMLTDSFPYLAWGRDAFGWPLEPAAFEFDGPLWTQANPQGQMSAFATANDLTIRLEGAVSAKSPLDEAPQVTWLTPRTVPDPSTLVEDPQLLIVYPRWVSIGERYELEDARLVITAGSDGRVRSFEGEIAITSADVLSGFTMVVGESVLSFRGQELDDAIAGHTFELHAQTQW